MGQYDIALRHVVARHARDLLQGLVPSFRVESASWMETQLTATERRMDKALDLRGGGRRRVLHLEIVVDPARLASRMCEYASMLFIALLAAAGAKGGRRAEVPPIKSVALLLSGRAKPWSKFGELRTSWPTPDRWSGHRFQIEPVYQRTVGELLARPGAFWLVFAPLAVDADVASMRRVLEEIRRREPRADERAELLGALLVVAELDPWGHNLKEEIKSMLREGDFEELMKFEFYREIFEKGMKRGVEQGIEKGVEKGIEKGIEKVIHRVLVRRMQRELTPEEQAALSSRTGGLDVEQATAVLDLDADALRAWLLGPDAE